MFGDRRPPWEAGYWHAQAGGAPNNPCERGTWMNEDWWFGYQQGLFEQHGLGEALKERRRG
jgi:hypothetical protein